AAASLYEKKAA
nr:Chain G, ALA-ALA-ALA-SER-LEU-TYR-GLU-LYS-LYS-ALA-ALA [Plasmodium falciparum 3D7]